MGCNNKSNEEDQWKQKRLKMVESQLRQRDITDPFVLKAMEKVPRHLFVPKESRDSAYMDGPLPIGFGQTISQPYMVALMTQCLRIKPTDKVLEIGTGSGYQTAILLELANEVFSIERVPELAKKARRPFCLLVTKILKSRLETVQRVGKKRLLLME